VFARVPAARAARIHFKLIAAPCLLRQMQKHALGERAAADISETDEQNAFHV
jgi:hypothetical protein